MDVCVEIDSCFSMRCRRFGLSCGEISVTMTQPARKVLIVGAGPTGALVANLLSKRNIPVAISIWEKSRGCGMYCKFCSTRIASQSVLHYYYYMYFKTVWLSNLLWD